jgi:hypothetical protein
VIDCITVSHNKSADFRRDSTLLVEVFSDKETGDEEGIQVEGSVGETTGLTLAGASDKRQRPGCDHRKRRTSMSCDLCEAPGRGGPKRGSGQSPSTVSLSGKFCTKRAAFMTAESADSRNESGEELRSQTDVEQSLAAGADHQAREKRVADKLLKALVPFQKLCNTERKEGYTEMIHGVKWTVYRSERGFDDLFWDYWRDCGEQWKDTDREKPPVPCTKEERETLAALARDKEAWEKRGKSRLAANFWGLARFRGYCDFESQVKVITGQDRLDRALPWFRRFLKSRFANEDMAEKAMAEYREKAFAPEQLDSLKDAFAKWRTEEVSRKRSEARGKRGRVKSKSDKRLGGRPRA